MRLKLVVSFISQVISTKASGNSVAPIYALRKGEPPKTSTASPSASPTAAFTLALKPSTAPSSFKPETASPLDGISTIAFSTPLPTSHPSVLVTRAPSPKPTIISSEPTSTPAIDDIEEATTDLQSTQFYRNQLFSPICSIFFPGEDILDERDVNVFEGAAVQFVAQHVNEINLPVVIVNVKDVTVVSQVLSWKRPSRNLREAATGLDVYFQVDVVATGYATKDELEHSFQALFDANNSAFWSSIELTAAEENPFDPTQLTLAVVAGCSGFVALMLTFSMISRKKKSRNDEQLSSPKSASIAKSKAKSDSKTEYPVQESRARRAKLDFDNVSLA
jgi:hypothetical protein